MRSGMAPGYCVLRGAPLPRTVCPDGAHVKCEFKGHISLANCLEGNLDSELHT